MDDVARSAPPVLPARVAAPQAATVQSIPVHRVRVLNPRSRSKKTFAEIVDNIAALGLKRPITVTIGGADDDGPRYDLVCGQGRLEAYQVLDEPMIPAIVIDASEADCYLMSLVENLARRHRSSIDLINAIISLKERGAGFTDQVQHLRFSRKASAGVLKPRDFRGVELMAQVRSSMSRAV